MKKVLTIAFMMCYAEMVMAQSIDLNKVNIGQETQVQEPGYVQWDIATIGRRHSDYHSCCTRQ